MQPNEPFRPGPPPFWPQRAPGPQVTRTPKIIGVLSIVFGSVVAAFSVWGVFSSGVALRFTRGMPDRLVEAYGRFVAETSTATTIQSAMFLVMSLVLIWVGMQQRKYRRIAVKASIWWGAIALLMLVGATLSQVLIFAPAMERWMQAVSDFGGGPTLNMGGFTKIAGFLSLVLYAPYPILLILTFRKPQIVDVMKE